MQFGIAIVAGGKSRRMGRDKAALVYAGQTLLERVTRAALGAGLPACVVGRECPADWTGGSVPFLPDFAPDCGPLGGLAAALAHFAPRGVLLAGCDMPCSKATPLSG